MGRFLPVEHTHVPHTHSVGLIKRTRSSSSVPRVRSHMVISDAHTHTHSSLRGFESEIVASAVRILVAAADERNIKWSAPALSPRSLWLIKPSYSVSAGLPLSPEERFVIESKTVHPLLEVKRMADRAGTTGGCHSWEIRKYPNPFCSHRGISSHTPVFFPLQSLFWSLSLPASCFPSSSHVSTPVPLSLLFECYFIFSLY